MKKHALISFIIIAVVAIVPAVAYATLTSSFGGKVILTSIPDVECYDEGTGPLLLLSNLESVGSAVKATNTTGGSATSHVSNTVYGVYGAIPYYAEQSSTTPKAGGWILGRASVIPSFSTCDLQLGTFEIPFPVRTTSNYRTSSNNSSSSFGSSSL